MAPTTAATLCLREDALAEEHSALGQVIQYRSCGYARPSCSYAPNAAQRCVFGMRPNT
jgi:hypothetical protein